MRPSCKSRLEIGIRIDLSTAWTPIRYETCDQWSFALAVQTSNITCPDDFYSQGDDFVGILDFILFVLDQVLNDHSTEVHHLGALTCSSDIQNGLLSVFVE
jgi:hypothetical protein